ncbi:MAG: DUF456 domain-containing protein [Bacteroidales bacterium]|nr:DUF456 domain-containing protein [Bacteroidales bacterium]
MNVLEILALVAAVFGIVGSIMPGLPGPPVSWVGMLLVFFAEKGTDNPMALTVLIVWLVITVVVSILDYVVPAWTTRAAGGHKAASTGALIGLLAGIFLTPIGMIAGALLGAFIGELMVTDKGVFAAFKAGLGAFAGFIFGTGLKLITSGIMCYLIVKIIFF